LRWSEAISEGDLLGYAFDYEQASKLRAPSPLVPPLPGESVRDRRDR
jgi:amidase